ncbi:hypothetical protein H4582DRAFT_768680 [Lactarius indigo]|nr:hypothetical protein H4582DRAFT_768680 [Lactarius indigo]
MPSFYFPQSRAPILHLPGLKNRQSTLRVIRASSMGATLLISSSTLVSALETMPVSDRCGFSIDSNTASGYIVTQHWKLCRLYRYESNNFSTLLYATEHHQSYCFMGTPFLLYLAQIITTPFVPSMQNCSGSFRDARRIQIGLWHMFRLCSISWLH